MAREQRRLAAIVTADVVGYAHAVYEQIYYSSLMPRTYLCARLLAHDLKEVGITVNCTPVLERSHAFETFLDRYLHNQTAAKVEQRLHLAGQHTVVLPLVVAA